MLIALSDIVRKLGYEKIEEKDGKEKGPGLEAVI